MRKTHTSGDRSVVKQPASYIITDIQNQVKNPERKSVFINGEFHCGISADTQTAFRLQRGQELTEKQLQMVERHEEYERAKALALRYLALRMRSQKELRDYLRKKECSDLAVERCIQYCLEHRYLDDRLFTEAFIRDKININQYGVRKIGSLLFRKGIDAALIRTLLNEVVDEEEQLQLARELARKKLKTLHTTDDQRRKLYRYLAQKGFTGTVTHRVISEIFG